MAVIEHLLISGVIERGLALKCERCRHASWYLPADLGERVTCRRCRYQQPINRYASLGAYEPEWRYGLAEVVYQFLTHDGAIPLIVASDVVRSAGGRIATEIGGELCFTHQDGTRSEIDIAARVGSRLVIGEATTKAFLESSARLEYGRIEKLRRVATDSSAARVIVATTEPVLREATRRRLLNAFGDRLDVREGIATSP